MLRRRCCRSKWDICGPLHFFALCFLKHGRGRGTGRLSSNNRSPKSALPAGKKCCVSFSILQYRFYPSKSTEQPLLPQPPQSRQTTCYHLWRWPSLLPSSLPHVLWRRGLSEPSLAPVTFLRHFPEPPLPPFPLGGRTDGQTALGGGSRGVDALESYHCR